MRSYYLIKYLCTPYPDELQLSVGLGNSSQLSMLTKCKTKYTRRHREGTRKQVYGSRAQGARASITRARRHVVSANKQSGKHTNEDNVRAGRCRVLAHWKDMQCKYPGKALDVSLALSLGITGHQNPLARVSARASFDQLHLLNVVENGPHGRPRMSSWVSFDNATWYDDTVPRLHWQTVATPWATPGAVHLTSGRHHDGIDL